MDLIAELKIHDLQGITHEFHIMKSESDSNPFFEIIKIEPEQKDVASADNFEQALDEIKTSLFYDEVDI